MNAHIVSGIVLSSLWVLVTIIITTLGIGYHYFYSDIFKCRKESKKRSSPSTELISFSNCGQRKYTTMFTTPTLKSRSLFLSQPLMLFRNNTSFS
jgi:hypothetical protein